MPLYPAASCDLPAVIALVNRAYRGADAGARDWATESAYIVGDRLTESLLAADLARNPDAALLLWRDDPGGDLLGCVWLEPVAQSESSAWYLGMLTVRPDRQERKLGRAILEAAEAWAAGRGAQRLRMTVVNIRQGLIAWYERRGYRLTGETLPFPYDDNRFGTPTRRDLSFVVLERTLV
jgi:GNAT superfamily N-acetyltransferase